MSTEQKRASIRQENRITRTFKQIQEDVRRTMASGALWFQKSDVVTNMFRIEAKTKIKPSSSITLKKGWFDKIEREAFESGKIGLIAFSFGDNKDYIAINSDDFIALMKELIELRKGGAYE